MYIHTPYFYILLSVLTMSLQGNIYCVRHIPTFLLFYYDHIHLHIYVRVHIHIHVQIHIHIHIIYIYIYIYMVSAVCMEREI